MSLARLAAFVVFVCSASAQTVIDFDDATGQLPPFSTGQPVRPAAMIDGQYLPLGVLFDSGGGGLARCVASNPVSVPNTVASTQPGPVISYTVPSDSSFWLGDHPAVVDYVQLTLSDTSSSSTLEAFDFQGNLLGTSSGGASATLRVDAPGEIHFARVQQGPMAFDDFTFDGLQPITALAVTPPRPGRAGTANTLVVTGAQPFEPLLLWIDIGGGEPAIVSTVADGSGEAQHTLNIPAALSGLPLRSRVAAPSSSSSPWVSDVLAPFELPQSMPSLSPKLIGSKKSPIPSE
jgi:hypothetical protein